MQDSHQRGTDKTDKTSILSVLAVPPKPQRSISEQRVPNGVEAKAYKTTSEIRPSAKRDCTAGEATTAEAVREIALLLAHAYERYSDLQQVLVEPHIPAVKQGTCYVGRPERS
jgi:hypothetical protein